MGDVYASNSKCRTFNPAVISVLSFFLIEYVIVVFLIILPWFSTSVPGLFHVLVFTILYVLAIASYIRAVFTHPGTVPQGWVPDMLESQSSHPLMIEIKGKGGSLRVCQKCKTYKPARCHHCRECGMCVLRMDHHCVWINNCVGHGNLKHFLLFIMYTVAASWHATVLYVAHALCTLDAPPPSSRGSVRGGTYHDHWQALLALIKVSGAVLVVPLSIALTILFGWHLYLLAKNRTTIEHHEGVRAVYSRRFREERDSCHGGGAAASGGILLAHQELLHPYDVGFCNNLHMVLGQNNMCWLLPIVPTHVGKGLDFESDLKVTRYWCNEQAGASASRD